MSTPQESKIFLPSAPSKLLQRIDDDIVTRMKRHFEESGIQDKETKKIVTRANDALKLVIGLDTFDKITQLEKAQYCQPMYLAMIGLTDSVELPASLVEHDLFTTVSKNSEALMTRLRERELAFGHLCQECPEQNESACAIYQAEKAKTDDDAQYVRIAIRAKPKLVVLPTKPAEGHTIEEEFNVFQPNDVKTARTTAKYTGGRTSEDEADAINNIGVIGEESYWVKYVRAAEKRGTTARAKKDLGKTGWDVIDENRGDFGGVVHVQGEDDNGRKEVKPEETGLLAAFGRLFK